MTQLARQAGVAAPWGSVITWYYSQLLKLPKARLCELVLQLSKLAALRWFHQAIYLSGFYQVSLMANLLPPPPH